MCTIWKNLDSISQASDFQVIEQSPLRPAGSKSFLVFICLGFYLTFPLFIKKKFFFKPLLQAMSLWKGICLVVLESNENRFTF